MTPRGHALDQMRVERFDPVNALFHSPTEYVFPQLQNREAIIPNDVVLDKMLEEFVRGEFGSQRNPEPPPSPWVIEDADRISIGDLKTYLETCENELVFSGIASGIIKRSSGDTIAQVRDLLEHPILGNVANKKYNGSLLDEALRNCLETKKRLCIIVPGFPFKDQNIFRTQCGAGHVDLAEIALLVRLHLLSIAIFQVHPYGMDWLIVTDGTAYAPMFRVDQQAVKRYHERLLHLREQLNIYGTVAFVDLEEVCHHLGDNSLGEDIFDSVKEAVASGLERILDRKGEIHETFRTLVRGIKWNMNFRDVAADLSLDRELLWLLITAESPDRLTKDNAQRWHALDELAVKSAIAYAAYNLTVRILRVFENVFPSCLRGTTHAKADQIAVPSLGISPWNGVALAESGLLGSTNVRVEPLYKASRRGALRAYYLEDDVDPFFYSVSSVS